MPAGDMPAGGRGAAFQYPAGELITSSLSNKGNATAFGQDNTFRVLDQNEVRIIDNKGNLLFSGTGPEAAREAVKIGENLSNTLGNKAGWTIQTGERTINPDGSVGATRFYDVANEKVNKSTLSKIANVAGTVLPIAMIPLTMGASAPLAGLGAAGNIALGAGVGAASAGLKGQNILKGGLMGGLTSAGGQFLSGPLQGAGLGVDAARAVGTGIGATAGGLATGQNLQNSLIGGVAAGGTTYLGSKLFGNTPSTDDLINQNVSRAMGNMENALIDAGAYAPDIADALYKPVTSGGAKAVSGSQSSFASVPADNLTITGTRIGTTPASSGSSPSFAVNTPVGGAPETIVTAQQQTPAAEPPAFAVNPLVQTPAVGGPDLDETIVTAQDEGLTQAEGPGGFINDFGLLSPELIATARREAALQDKDNSLAVDTSGLLSPELVATAPKDQLAVKDEGSVGGPLIKSDYVVTAPKDTPKFNEDGEYTGPLVNIPSLVDDFAQEEMSGKDKDDKSKLSVKEMLALLAAAGALGGGGSGGGTGTGTGTGGKFQDVFTKKLPTPGEGGSLKVGGLKGPTLGAAGTFSARPTTDWYRFGMGPAMDIPAGTDLSGATSPYAGYGPGTLGQETFKAVSGIPEQPTGMSHGGPMGYSRGSSRESFAVEGPGTGRSDDIPAVLSDGEYVIDAETVALLGDGSSKAGAKRLDELRVNLRKHKGRNLAKGKFSVNAKRPEKYLSGGRA